MTKIKPFENAGGYTTFDNAILDLIMPICKPNTWKVLCATVRKTRGWGKEKDAISLTQFMELTGIGSRATVMDAVNDAINSGLLIVDKSRKTSVYSLNRQYEIDTSTVSVPVHILDQYQYRNSTDNGTETVHTKEKRKKKELIDVPTNLCTDDFLERWEEFKEHRKEIKKPMSGIAQKRMLIKLSKEAVEVAVKMLDQSIVMGWQGVFELKDDKQRTIGSNSQNLPEGI